MNLYQEKSILASISTVTQTQTEVVQRFDALGAIPVGFNGLPILEWIDEPGYVGQVDDPCASIQAQINNQQAARNQLNQTKVELQQAALQAAQAGDQTTANQLTAQANSLTSQIAAADANIAQLKKLLADCKKLKPGCTTPDGTPSPECPPGQVCVGGKCVTPSPAPEPQCSDTKPCPAGQKCVAGTCVPATTSSTSKPNRSWLLLAAAAVGATIFAFKGA